jgi:CRISPR-associated protein Cas2
MQEEKGQQVWRNVFKISKRYLHHIQNSVFEGDLTEAQILSLKNELKHWIRDDKDSVLLFKSRDSKWLKKEYWGKEENLTSEFL